MSRGPLIAHPLTVRSLLWAACRLAFYTALDRLMDAGRRTKIWLDGSCSHPREWLGREGDFFIYHAVGCKGCGRWINREIFDLEKCFTSELIVSLFDLYGRGPSHDPGNYEQRCLCGLYFDSDNPAAVSCPQCYLRSQGIEVCG